MANPPMWRAWERREKVLWPSMFVGKEEQD